MLTVVAHFGQVLAGVGVVDNGAAGDVDYYVFAVATATTIFGTALAVAGKYVTFEFERQQCPHVSVAAQYDVSAASAVAAVGTALGDVFGAVEVQ